MKKHLLTINVDDPVPVLFDGKRVQMQLKPLKLLVVLAFNAGKVVRYSELMRRIWGETIVEDGNIMTSKTKVNKALGVRLVKSSMGRGLYLDLSPENVTILGSDLP